MLKKTPITKILRRSGSNNLLRTQTNLMKHISEADHIEENNPTMFAAQFEEINKKIKQQSLKRQYDYNELSQMIAAIRKDFTLKHRAILSNQKIEKIDSKGRLADALHHLTSKGKLKKVNMLQTFQDSFSREHQCISPFKNKSIADFLKPSSDKTIKSEKDVIALQQQIKIKTQSISSKNSIQDQINLMSEKFQVGNLEKDIQKYVRKQLKSFQDRFNENCNNLKVYCLELNQKTERNLQHAKIQMENSISNLLNAKIQKEVKEHKLEWENNNKSAKQLNEFLVNQMLKIYQKMRDIETDLSSTKQQIQTKTTISNASIITEDKTNRSLSQKMSLKVQDSEMIELNTKIQFLQTHRQDNEYHFVQIENKVVQNQKMLYELITINRMLSSKVTLLVQSLKTKKSISDINFQSIPEELEESISSELISSMEIINETGSNEVITE